MVREWQNKKDGYGKQRSEEYDHGYADSSDRSSETNGVDIHSAKGKPTKRENKNKRKRKTNPESATILLTTSRKAEKSKVNSKAPTSLMVLGRYPPIECVNDLVIWGDFLRNEELEKSNTI